MTFAVIDIRSHRSIHHAPVIKDGFDTLAEAHSFIAETNLTRVNVIAISDGQRRWLKPEEDIELGKAIVATR